MCVTEKHVFFDTYKHLIKQMSVTENKKMLPTEVENLVGHYAYGEGRYNLSEEVDFCAANRGMIPDTFLEHTVTLDGRTAAQTARVWALSCYTVKNPLRTDSPFFPWALIDKRSPIFGNTFIWWMAMIETPTFRKLKTYRSTFRHHVVRLTHRGRDMIPEWNTFMNRYLATDYLLSPQSYDLQEGHEQMFSLICDELGNAGYLTPMISLPPRPSQRSVLSQVSGHRA